MFCLISTKAFGNVFQSGVTTKEPIDQAVKKVDFSNFRLLCVLVVVCMCCVV